MLESDVELGSWWIQKLQPSANAIVDSAACWRAVPGLGSCAKVRQLKQQLKAIDMCLAFVVTVDNVEKTVEATSNLSQLRDSGKLLPAQSVEFDKLQKLKVSSEAAKLWLSMQPTALVALAQTRKLSNDMLDDLEHTVLTHSTLGEAESEVLLNEVRDLNAAKQSAQSSLVQMYEKLEDRMREGGLQPRSTYEDPANGMPDASEPLLDPA